MVSVMANLALKTDLALRPAGGGEISGLTTLSRRVAEIANVTPLDYQPFVGRSAFAHKGGVHGAAVAKVERTYQHVDPTLVGNESRARGLGARRPRQHAHPGRAAGSQARRASIDPRALSQTIKELENQGLAFEGAEASFELLIRRKGADYAPPFQIVDYTVLSEQREGRELLAEATVKVRVDGEVLHTAADGNGPVNALDAALRKALGRSSRTSSPCASWTTRSASSTASRPRRRAPASSSTRSIGDARVVHDGLRHEHHRGLRGGPGRLARVRHLEALEREPSVGFGGAHRGVPARGPRHARGVGRGLTAS